MSSQHGYTPLHKAVINDDKKVVQLLLGHGAEVDTVASDVCKIIIKGIKERMNTLK